MTLRKYAAALCIAAAAISFTGCSGNGSVSESAVTANLTDESFTAETILDTAYKSTLEQKSSSAVMNLKFSYNGDNGETTASVKTDILSVSEPVFKHIKMDVAQNDTHFSQSEFYVDEVDSETNSLYVDYEDAWYKMPVNDGELFSILGQYDIREVLNILLTNSTDCVVGDKEKINGYDAYKVDAVITADKVPDVVINTGIFVANGLTNLYAEYFAGVVDMPVTFYIDSETGNVVKFTFDAKDAFQVVSDYAYEITKGVEGFENSERLVVNSYLIDTDITEINTAQKLEIPNDVLKAVELPSISESMESINSGASSSAE